MKWEQKDGFMFCDIELKSLILYGVFRFLGTNQKIANAVLIDSVSGVYRYGYVIETRNNNLRETYSFKCSVETKYKDAKKNTERIKEWCFNQKLI